MASTNHTSNYNLPQWVKTDPFRMEDFNDAFQKIDTAVKAAEGAGLKMAFGSYPGNDKYTEADPNTLTFDFEPKLLIITRSANSGSNVLLTAIRGQNAMRNTLFNTNDASYLTNLKWEGNTVKLWSSSDSGAMNWSLYGPYYYFAIG